MQPIEIFRTGTHTAMGGQRILFSAETLAATATAYQPAFHEAPICIGHPAHDAPAFGWIKGLRVDGDRLVADVDQVEPQFAEMVQAGRFKKLSAAFYEPDAADNPKPGSYYLRHVGFLGAQPPAVKGLKPVAFAAGGAGVVAFGDYGDTLVVRILRRLRDHFIATDGQDAADKIIDGYDLDALATIAAQPDPEPETESSTMFSEAELARRAAEITARETAITERETAIGARETGATERERATRRAGDVTFAEQLEKEGKLLPAHRAGLLAFMEQVHDLAGTVAFGEGTAAVKQSGAEFLRGFLQALPNQVEFAERARSEEIAEVTAPGISLPAGATFAPARGELHRKALAYAAQHKVDYVAAVRHLGG